MTLPDPQAAPLASSATAAALEWPSLLALVAALAATDLGQERLLALAPHTAADDLERHRRRYREAERLRVEGRLVPSFEQPLGDLLERLETGRPPLAGGDLVRLAALVRATGAAARRIAEADPPCPELAALTEGLADLAPLEREIAAKLDRRGEVRDDASPELVALRRRIRSARDQLYRDLGGFVGEHRDSLGDETIPMRGGRLMVVLDAGARGRVPGLVHGRSATGKSFYFEPLSAVELGRDLALERREVRQPVGEAGELRAGRVGGGDAAGGGAGGAQHRGQAHQVAAGHRRAAGGEPGEEVAQRLLERGDEPSAASRVRGAQPLRLAVAAAVGGERLGVLVRRQGEGAIAPEVAGGERRDQRQQARPLERRRGGGRGQKKTGAGSLRLPDVVPRGDDGSRRRRCASRRHQANRPRHAKPCLRSSASLRRAFFRAWASFRLRFTDGFSKCCRLRSSVSRPDFSTFRLKRRRAFSKLSSSRT